MAESSGQKYLRALNKSVKAIERREGVKLNNAEIVAAQKALAKKMDQRTARDAKRPASSSSKPSPKPPTQSPSKPATSSSASKPSPSSSSRPRPGQTGSGSSPSTKKRPSSSGGPNTGGGVSRRDVAGVAGAAAAAGAAAVGAKVASNARTNAATTRPGYNARGGMSAGQTGYVKRPQRSGLAARAGENWGRGVRTGAAGSKQAGRPSSTAQSQPTRPASKTATARVAAQQRKTGRNPTVKGRAVRSGYGTGVGRFSMRKPG